MFKKSKKIYQKGKLFVLIGLLLSISSISARAELRTDEGMWLPMLVERLNYANIQEKGLNLTPGELYNINNSSVKDAIAGLASGSAPQGYFCTAEVVSSNGLLFTNHHCGYGAIQSHSSVEHDYLTDGFWARSYDEELPNEDMTASFLIRMDDVTENLVSELSDTLSGPERMRKIREITSRLEEEATEDGKYDVVVKSFYEGNEFYRFVYLTYKDVRLVGAPPESIGNYGGDTDNWMWPRHTGDFSIFRVYTAPDGSPAKYSEENVPLDAKYHLSISLKPKKEDDFAMIWGYPGGTDRYLTSYGVDFQLNETNPVLIKLLGAQLEVMEIAMQKSENVRIMYASKEARLSNGYKYFKGQTKGLKALNVKADKEQIEKKFTDWIDANQQHKEKYDDVLTNIESAYASLKNDMKAMYYASIAGMSGAEIIRFASNFKQLKSLLEQDEPNEEALNKAIENIKEKAEGHFKNYHAPTDQKLLAHMMNIYYTNVRMSKQPDFFREVIIKEYSGDFEEYAEDVFKKSIFVSREGVDKFLEKPKANKLERDPAFQAMESMMGASAKMGRVFQQSQMKLNNARRLFIEGLRKMNPDKHYYPDANSSMRFTYGEVGGYKARDAVYYQYQTTLEGAMAKKDPSDTEFHVPEKLEQLYNAKNYGRYGENGEMPIAFLTDNDITGGNSGSPVLNGDGELIGIAFDGNWEAMSGDIAFEPKIQRTISVDIRYVLFVIDKFAGAQNLIDELTIVE